MLMHLSGLGKAGFELVAQRHQFIDFGDDAVLFSEGRHWDVELLNIADAQVFNGLADCGCRRSLQEMRFSQGNEQISIVDVVMHRPDQHRSLA